MCSNSTAPCIPPCLPACIKHGNDPKFYFKGFREGIEEGPPVHTMPAPPPSHPSSPTFALGHRGGAVEVGGGVAGTGNAVILPKIGLVGAHGAADAAVDARVVVMPGGALDWGGGGGGQRAKGAVSATGTAPLGVPCPQGPAPTYLWCRSPGRRGLPRGGWSAPRRRGSRAPAPPRAGRTRGDTAGRA